MRSPPSRLDSNPGLTPGDYLLENPIPRQCCDLGESGVAAVDVGHPTKRIQQGFQKSSVAASAFSPGREPGVV